MKTKYHINKQAEENEEKSYLQLMLDWQIIIWETVRDDPDLINWFLFTTQYVWKNEWNSY